MPPNTKLLGVLALSYLALSVRLNEYSYQPSIGKVSLKDLIKPVSAIEIEYSLILPPSLKSDTAFGLMNGVMESALKLGMRIYNDIIFKSPIVFAEIRFGI